MRTQYATSASPSFAPVVPTTLAPATAATPPPKSSHTATTHAPAPPALGHAPSATGAVGGTVFALLFVVALILALAWLARRMPGVAGAGTPALRVVASLSLGPRERVVVVDVGGTQLLLGVGAAGTRALHTLTTPLPGETGKRTVPFAELLAQHFGKKP